MHVAEGALSGEVIMAGAVAAALGVAVGLRRMDYDRVPQVAVLSAAFFVASLIHVPVGPSSTHLVLNGLCGLVLGWAVFPAMLVALFLQAVLFGFGGVTALGVNTVIMAAPGVACYYLFSRGVRSRSRRTAFSLGFLTGATAIVLGAVVLGLALLATSGQFLVVVKAVILAHIPVMVIEGVITGTAVVFLRRVCPEILEAPLRPGEQGKTAYA